MTWESFPVPFVTGEQDKVNPFIAPPNMMETTENVYEDKTGRIVPKNGDTTVPSTTIDSGSVNNVKSLISDNKELLAINDKGEIWSYSDQEDKWTGGSPGSSVSVDHDDIVAFPHEMYGYHLMASLDNYDLYVHVVDAVRDSGSDYASTVTVVDTATGSLIRADESIIVSGSAYPQLRPNNTAGSYGIGTYPDNNKITVYWTESSNRIQTMTFDTTTQAFSVGNIDTGEVEPDILSLVVRNVNNTYNAICYNESFEGLKVAIVEHDNTVTVLDVTNTGFSASPPNSNYDMFIHNRDGNTLNKSALIAYVDTSNNLRSCTVNVLTSGTLSLSETRAAQIVASSIPANPRAIVGHTKDESTDQIYWYVMTGSFDETARVTWCFEDFKNTNVAATNNGSQVWCDSIYPIGEVFEVNSRHYMPAYVMTTDQPTLYVVDVTDKEIVNVSTYKHGHFVARMPLGASSNAVRTSVDCLAKNLMTVSGTTVTFPMIFRNQSAATANNAAEIQLLKKVTLEFEDNLQHTVRPLAKYLGGAGSHVITMSQQRPIAPWQYPMNLTVAQTGTGTFSSGTYGIGVVFKTFDQSGRISESAPVTETVTITLASQQIQIDFYLPPLGVFRNAANSITVEGLIADIYVTQDGGTKYTYLQTEYIGGNTLGGTHQVFITTPSTITAAASNRALYTTGGVLDHIHPPPAYATYEGDGRVWIVNGTFRDEIWYSKTISAGVAPSFNETLVFRASGGEKITGMAFLDGRKVVFRNNSISFFAGAGPNALGQGSFSSEQTISTDVGCIDPKTIAVFRDGVMFKSDKGWCLLDKGLNTSYIGAPVEDFNDDAVRQAVVVDSDHLIRIYPETDTDSQLIYDYFHKRWYVWTDEAVVTAAVWQDAATRVTTDTPTVISKDTGSPGTSSILIETGWIRLASIAGFQRIRGFTLSGENMSGLTVNVEFLTSAEPGGDETATTTEYTVEGDYISFAEIRFQKQKCSAVKIRITKTAATASMQLAEIAFLIRRKRGHVKIPDTGVVGSKYEEA